MKRTKHTYGMTLIELILVMAVLTTLMAISAPRLGRFFAGRSLTEESRRFLALTRYGRSEAIARSTPMKLWVDPERGTYGLEPQIEFGTDRNADIEYVLAANLVFEIQAEALDEDGMAAILFWPDGTIDETSVRRINIVEDAQTTITIAQVDYGLGYAVSDEMSYE